MKGFLSLLAKAGIGEFVDEAAPAEAEASAAVPPPRGSPSAPAPAPVPAAPGIDPEVAAKIDQMARSKLEAAMDRASQHVDQFADTLETLADVVPDENVRYRKAIELLAKRGISGPALLGDLDACIGALEQEERTFVSELQGQLESQVGSKHRAVQKMDEEIGALRSQIAALEASLSALQARRDAEQSGIAGAEGKLNATKARFSLVYKQIRASVEAQKSKVLQHGVTTNG